LIERNVFGCVLDLVRHMIDDGTAARFQDLFPKFLGVRFCDRRWRLADFVFGEIFHRLFDGHLHVGRLQGVENPFRRPGNLLVANSNARTTVSEAESTTPGLSTGSAMVAPLK
jgi:hypothetical protein